MSYQLAFWKTGKRLNWSKVYSKIIEGKSVRGLDVLDPREVEQRILAAFPGWAVEQSIASGSDGTTLAAEDCALEVHYAPQGVVCTCYGMNNENLNRIIDAMNALAMPLYDPQTRERFAVP